MNVRKATAGGLALGLALLLLSPAHAVIIRLYPLKDVLKEHEFIAVARVEKLLPDRPAMVLTVTDDLKAKFPARRLPVNLTGDDEAKKENHTAALLKRLAPELPVVLFANQRGKKLTVFAYTNGTWFQMVGQKTGEGTVFAFTHGEPYLRRTFKGTTEEMRQAVADGLSGKRQPPEVNEKEPPGFGPEVTPARTGRGPATARPLFAVIPTLGVGGPLAILALLFPTVFGGVLLLFRQWLAFFTVLSVNLTLLFLHGWFAADFYGAWWTTPGGLWTALTLVTVAGVLWAWWRHGRALATGVGPAPAPVRTELIVLWVLTAACVGAAAVWVLTGAPSLLDPWWGALLSFALGIGVAAAVRTVRAAWPEPAPEYDPNPASEAINPGPQPALPLRGEVVPPALPTEGVILGVVLFVMVGLAAARPSGQGVSITSDSGAAGEGRPVVRLVESQFQNGKPWTAVLAQNGGGLIVSSPRVVGDRLFVSVAHKKGFETFGAVYCLDRDGKVVWTFDDDAEMKQAYSSPCVADGRLYVGEGFHDDQNCKVYCVNVADGTKRWHFPTKGQTESTPVVAGGKVFFGAGNEGVYALDAASGKQLWRFPEHPEKGRLLRFGATPLVVDNRVYIGSGVDRNRPQDPGETALFCLDADTGKQVWKVPVDLPCWGAAALGGDRVYFPLGNGDVFTDAPKPGGAVVCLSAVNGRQRWRQDVPNGVLERPALDRHRVFFGARDGKLYCVGRYDGRPRWEAIVGSPVVAAPALDCANPGEKATTVYAIGTTGQVHCLDAATGRAHWSYRGLEADAPHLSGSPALVTESTPEGDRRRLYFGAALNNLTIPALFCLEDFLPEG